MEATKYRKKTYDSTQGYKVFISNIKLFLLYHTLSKSIRQQFHLHSPPSHTLTVFPDLSSFSIFSSHLWSFYTILTSNPIIPLAMSLTRSSKINYLRCSLHLFRFILCHKKSPKGSSFITSSHLVLSCSFISHIPPFSIHLLPSKVSSYSPLKSHLFFS